MKLVKTYILLQPSITRRLTSAVVSSGNDLQLNYMCTSKDRVKFTVLEWVQKLGFGLMSVTLEYLPLEVLLKQVEIQLFSIQNCSAMCSSTLDHL